MAMTTSTRLLNAVRAEALFTSDLSTESDPTCAEVTATIRRAIRLHGGNRGCATVLAREYGEHPRPLYPGCVGRWAWSTPSTHAPVTSVRFDVSGRFCPVRW